MKKYMTAETNALNQHFSQHREQEAAANKQIYSVSDLNQLVSRVLTQQFPLMWIKGEISNLTRAASGHWYFSLKDARAQVRCVMFRGQNRHVDWQPVEGDEVEARCTVTLYEARGDYQLNIEFMQQAGLGSLYAAFEALKKQLAKEGLFDEDNKKALPPYPASIGIVTSSNAAALRDVLTTLKRRAPSVRGIIYPTPVQGKGAAETIAQQIHLANQRQECDVLIVCRGGGSIEDLWQFNEAIVARSIADSQIPVISGIGHETDFTISDFVADIRAATPTAAAEIVSQSQVNLIQQLAQMQQQLQQNMQARLNQLALNLDYAAKRLISPAQRLAKQQDEIQGLRRRLNNAIKQQLSMQQQKLQHLAQSLHHLNPNAVLTRGYAIVENAKGEVVQSKQAVTNHEALTVMVSDGQFSVKVTPAEPNAKEQTQNNAPQSGLFD